jgi:maltooligosyltrehalose trehalohydrolase
VADDVSDRTGRRITIVAESDLNDPRVIRPQEVGGHGLDAQWADDFHHVLHAFLTGETRGYYMDYATGGREALARVMRTPFLFAWDYSPHRGRKHGASAEGISGDHFVVCAQNHDQVGNRAAGDRLSTLVKSPAQLRLSAALVLLSPYLPLLFMGEEYGETKPFPFFCSFYGQELIQAVREGRRREFADFHDGAGDVVPDPDAPSTFESAKVSWSWTEAGRAGLRRLHADLLHARRAWPALRDFENRHARLLPDADGAVLELVRGGAVAESLRALFNLSDRPQPLPHDEAAGRSILLATEWSRYGGTRRDGDMPSELAPFECIVFGPATWQC